MARKAKQFVLFIQALAQSLKLDNFYWVLEQLLGGDDTGQASSWVMHDYE
jgi:hypothetical protein